MRESVRDYLIIVGWALPSALFFRLYTTLNQALGRPQLVTWMQVRALVLKVPLSIWFTFGGWGIAPQGAAGCAWATLLVDYAIAIAAVVLMRTQGFYRPLRLWQRLEAPRLAAPARVFAPGASRPGWRLGWRSTSFTLVALFVARQGTLSAASHQIAANLAAVCYMLPLSLGIAVSARASWWRGQGQELRAQQVAWLGVRLALACGIVLCGAMLLHAPLPALVYTGDAAGDRPDGLAIAVGGAVPGGRQRAMRVHFCTAQLARDAGAAARLLHLAVGRWPRGWVLACLHKQSYFR